jgi:two-component system sensor histidine kinase and response regulator WspE
MTTPDLSQFSMHDLFHQEVDGQREILTIGLLALERDPRSAAHLEALMRAAHSLKGAARIVGLGAAVSVAHAMEDCFVAAQQGSIVLGKTRIDLLLRGLDLLVRIANTPEASAEPWSHASAPEAASFQIDMAAVEEASAAPLKSAQVTTNVLTGSSSSSAPRPKPAPQPDAAVLQSTISHPERPSRTLRVTAQNLNRLLGLSGETLVESRWLTPFAAALLKLKRMQGSITHRFHALQEVLSMRSMDESASLALDDMRSKLVECEQFLSARMAELEIFEQRSSSVARRLYDEAISCRMRPFSDGTQMFPRMVRDLAHELGKQARLELAGETTQVDRDVLEKLDATIGHLLRNALDHGIEPAAIRLAAGKSAEGCIRLEARHTAGMLQISVSDDGCGIDLDHVRRKVVERGLAEQSIADQLTEAELLEFLFLPGFTIRDAVTEISGRGVGLDAVQSMVKQLRGSLRVTTARGLCTKFQMHLPLTVSVVRTLLTEIGGEPYAFPLAFIVSTLTVPRADIQLLEGRQHFNSDGRQVGLVAAMQVFGGTDPELTRDQLPVVVVGDHNDRYGVVVDRFLGVRELVVQALDPRLGKIKDVTAGALLESGVPVLIVDVDDLMRSVDKLIVSGQLNKVEQSVPGAGTEVRKKRVLVVDDSLTVRELERKLIESGGFEVEVAVDGADGWNAVRLGQFDLVVTDVDMPRMDGIGLVSLIKQDARLHGLPVMIVSYKDREEDRRRGLEAGADFYLTKGSFHDETLLQAVRDLIGSADAASAI